MRSPSLIDPFTDDDYTSSDLTAARDFFPGPNPDAKVKEIQTWLKSKGVRDLEPVPLTKVQMAKVKRRFLLYSLAPLMLTESSCRRRSRRSRSFLTL